MIYFESFRESKPNDVRIKNSIYIFEQRGSTLQLHIVQLNILPNIPNIEKPNSQRWKITTIGYLALMHEKMQLIFLPKYGRSVQLNILCYIIHRFLSRFETQVQNYLLGKTFDLVSKSMVWFNMELSCKSNITTLLA